MRGRLDAAPLLELLSALRRFRKSGSLLCQSALRSIEVEIVNGQICSVSTSDPSQRIGQVLIQLGFISEEQIEQALALQTVAPDPERVGEVLVDVGFITEPAIGEAMATQIASALMVMLHDDDRELVFHVKPNDEQPSRDDHPSSDPLILVAAFLSEFWLEQGGVDPETIESDPDMSLDGDRSIENRLRRAHQVLASASVDLGSDQPRVDRSLAFLLDHVQQSYDAIARNHDDLQPDTQLELVDRQVNVWEMADLTRGARAALLEMLNGAVQRSDIAAAIRESGASEERVLSELFESGLIRQIATSESSGQSATRRGPDEEDRTFVMRFLP
jgi:hypothetical protein